MANNLIMNELPIGEVVTVEIVWGESSNEIKSTVVGKNADGVLLAPVSYKGIVLDMVPGKFADMIIHIHCIDKETNSRKVWRNVEISSTVYKARMYYVVKSKKFSPYAESSDRRKQVRTKLDISGTLHVDGEEQPRICELKDISDTGIGFYMEAETPLASQYFEMEISDSVRGEIFNIKAKYKISRTLEEDGKTLYGCALRESNKDLLMYVFIKRMEGKSPK